LRRVILTHITFKRKTGIRFFKNIPGRTGGPAKVALGIFLSVKHIFVSAHTFGRRIFTRIYRKIYISYRVTDHPDARPRRIIAAIFRVSVKGGADYLAGTATITFFDIDLNCLDFLLNFGHF
jgi:hypothetical protein